MLRCLGLLAAVVSFATPAAAKEFRSYYGMQWIVTPRADARGTIVVKKGDMVAEADLLTQDLFETTAPVVVGGKTILGKNAQLATAVSQKSIRCTVARGETGSLSETRRICLTDADGDGLFDHYFDVGLGQGGGDVQFSGCMPNDAIAIEPVRVAPVDPMTLHDPMKFRITLSGKGGARVVGADGKETIPNPWFTFGGSVGRNDRIWNYYSFCTARGCRLPLGVTMGTGREGIALRVAGQEGDKVRIEILRNLATRPYWDMSRGHRPDPFYCPGTLFVKTDVADF